MTLMRPGRILLAGLLTLPLACCTPEQCLPENLPYKGDPEQVDQLFELAQYAAREGCDSALYALLSHHSQEEIGQTKFDLFWASIDIEGYGYELGDVVADGTYSGSTGPLAWNPSQEFAYVEYDEDGPGPLPNLFAQILVVHEPDAQGHDRPRIGLQEQVDYLKAGDWRYNWDASGEPPPRED